MFAKFSYIFTEIYHCYCSVHGSSENVNQPAQMVTSDLSVHPPTSVSSSMISLRRTESNRSMKSMTLEDKPHHSMTSIASIVLGIDPRPSSSKQSICSMRDDARLYPAGRGPRPATSKQSIGSTRDNEDLKAGRGARQVMSKPSISSVKDDRGLYQFGRGPRPATSKQSISSMRDNEGIYQAGRGQRPSTSKQSISSWRDDEGIYQAGRGPRPSTSKQSISSWRDDEIKGPQRVPSKKRLSTRDEGLHRAGSVPSVRSHPSNPDIVIIGATPTPRNTPQMRTRVRQGSGDYRQ